MSIFDINPEDNVTREYLYEKGFTAILDTDIYIYCDVRGIVRYRFETEMLDLVVRDEQMLMSAHLKVSESDPLGGGAAIKTKHLCVHIA